MPESRDRRITRRQSLIDNWPVVPTPPQTAVTGRPHHAPGNTPLVASARRRSAPVVPIPPSRSVLPPWYPRTPLRDITAIVRAIERRRARLGEEDEVGSDQVVVLGRTEDSASASSVGVKLRTPLGSKVPKAERERRMRTLRSMR